VEPSQYIWNITMLPWEQDRVAIWQQNHLCRMNWRNAVVTGYIFMNYIIMDVSTIIEGVRMELTLRWET